MKKILLLLFFVSQTVHAQIDWATYSQTFPDNALDKPSTVALILAVRRDNDSFWRQHDSNEAFAKLAKDTAFQRQHAPDPIGRPTFDTAQVHFFLHGVTPKNAQNYQVRVTDYTDQRIILPWQSVERFTDSSLSKSAGLPQMAYLGGYTVPLGHMLIVDVRRADALQPIGTAMVARVSIRPVYTSVYTSDNLDAFLRKLQYPWAKETNPSPPDQSSGSLMLPATNTNMVLLLAATIYSKEQVQYELLRDGVVVKPWQNNEYDNSFIWLKDYTPGDYRLRIRYTAQPEHVTDFDFQVLPHWYQTGFFKLITGLVMLAGTGALVLIILFVRQRQKNRADQAKRTKLQLELKAIYAQLNPHFVFNAMSSIQGLINKQDIQGANQYLADFARLMRESLTNSTREEVSLDEEIQMLTTYLRLEQLRFGFRFQITADETINTYDTDIPALLLQPLVENAVKHGVSGRGEAGEITVHFGKIGDTLTSRIIDNGAGTVDENTGSGFGLKLTRDRIGLLNELNRLRPVQLVINHRLPVGTEVVIRFTHWFA